MHVPDEPCVGGCWPVFKSPGATSSSVEDLVRARLLMAARNLTPALQFVAELDTASPDLDRVVEEGKKTFAGYELNGQTLGIVGLGKIGCLVAEAAIGLGMQVMGYDPDISIDAAWSLPSHCLLYTSPSPRDRTRSRMPSSA